MLKSHRDYLGTQLETLDYSRVIIPVNIGIKYRPPKIGIEFYLKNDEVFDRAVNRPDSMMINDIENFNQKLLVHEIHLDRFFFTKEAQIHGERSYDLNRENAHMSPLKQKLCPETICRSLYYDKQHSAFLNPKIIKEQQIERLLKMMIDKYSNFYRERSASRDKIKRKDDSENINTNNQPPIPKPTQQKSSNPQPQKSDTKVNQSALDNPGFIQ